jgi:hypothetical protein
MTLTGTWAKTRTGTLTLTWTVGEAPVRHPRNPPTPAISEGKHRD